MSVQIATLDILTKRARFDPLIALAIAEGIELECNILRQDLATKDLLLDVRTELKAQIVAVRADLMGDIERRHHDLTLNMESLRSDLLRTLFTTVIGAMATQTALLTGVMYFLLQNSHR
jgi:hypothetical protein